MTLYYAVLLTSSWLPSSTSGFVSKTLRSLAEFDNKPGESLNSSASLAATSTPTSNSLGSTAAAAALSLTKTISTANASEVVVRTLGIRGLARRLRAWPLSVHGGIDHFRGERFYKASLDLPASIQLKVRSQPKLDARVIGVLPPGMMVRATAISGHWVLIQFGDGTNAGQPGWMLSKNRLDTELLVPETNQYQIARALAAGVSPFPCGREDDKKQTHEENDGNGGDDDFEDIVDMLATRAMGGGGELDEETNAVMSMTQDAPQIQQRKTFTRLKEKVKDTRTKRERRRGVYIGGAM